jgi:hypothetical protein
MNTYSTNLNKARDILGSYDAIGKVCGGLSGKAVMKWRNNGRPPRTEYTGETKYAEKIAEATGYKVKVADLLPGINQDNAA